MKSTINKCSLTPIPKRKKTPTCDPHWYDALYKIKLKFVRHSFISYYSNFPSFNSSQVKVFQNYIKHSSDLLFFNANKKNQTKNTIFFVNLFFFFTQNTCVLCLLVKKKHTLEEPANISTAVILLDIWKVGLRWPHTRCFKIYKDHHKKAVLQV